MPGDHPGLEVEGRTTTMGLRASETAELRLSDVRLPEDALLGSVGGGLAIALDWRETKTSISLRW